MFGGFGFDDMFSDPFFSGFGFNNNRSHRHHDHHHHHRNSQEGDESNNMIVRNQNPFSFFPGMGMHGFDMGGGTMFSSSSSSSSFGGPGSFYSSSTTSSMGPGGVMETKQITRDSSGKQKIVTKRQIGDKSVEVVEEKDKDAREVRHQKVKNMDIHDLNDFEREWKNQSSSLSASGISFSTGEGRHRMTGRALSSGPVIQEIDDDEHSPSQRRALPSSASNTSSSSSPISQTVISSPSAVEEPDYIPTTVTIDADEEEEVNQRGGREREWSGRATGGNGGRGVRITEVEDDDNEREYHQHHHSSHGLHSGRHSSHKHSGHNSHRSGRK